jgi:hypothetical protein
MRVEDRSPLDPLLGPDATTKHLTVSHPLHQSDVARVRFGAALFSILSRFIVFETGKKSGTARQLTCQNLCAEVWFGVHF